MNDNAENATENAAVPEPLFDLVTVAGGGDGGQHEHGGTFGDWVHGAAVESQGKAEGGDDAPVGLSDTVGAVVGADEPPVVRDDAVEGLLRVGGVGHDRGDLAVVLGEAADDDLDLGYGV